MSDVQSPHRRSSGIGLESQDGQSYYGQSLIKPPVWRPEVGWYLFAGGLAGASALMGAIARARGNRSLARSAQVGAMLGAVSSPILLIVDLGRPERFHHMLRVFKPTSPMNVGTWILSAFGSLSGAAAASEVLGVARPAGRIAEWGSAVLGPALAAYTSVLLADTAVPVWHRARRLLPFVFAGGAAASAGALATVITDPKEAEPARRMAIAGAIVELGASSLMERSLGEYGAPYQEGRAQVMKLLAAGLSLPGAALLAFGDRRRRSRRLAVLGGSLILAGAVAERFAIFRAGFESASSATTGSRARIE